MGSSSSAMSGITEDLLEEYVLLTYLNKAEILHLYKTFTNIGSEYVQDFHRRYSAEFVEMAFPQLKYNPFRDRIYRVFSAHGDGKLSFEDILDLCSVMSEKCPDKVKAAWAFRIFDFDEDGVVGERDLMTAIDRLTLSSQNPLNEINFTDKKRVIEVLLKEIDLENNGSIGELEFQHAVGKMAEFPTSFCFRF